MQNSYTKLSQDWERRVVLELYKEYESIVRDHKLKLNPAAISLFDSQSHWGQWDRHSRTIFISRKLIQDHSWFQVQSILRHEMAHQLDDYENKAHFTAPHGASFLSACRRVGVPAEFMAATANLQENNPDWKHHKKNEKVERLLSKVQKLLALATSTNEHESLLAMEKVRELYTRHNLEKATIQSQSEFAHLIITHRKKRIEATQNKITGILVGYFFVKVIQCSSFDSRSGDYYKAIELIGRRENVLMAEYVYHFLLNQINFLARELQRSKKNLSRLERKSYQLGILQGFEDKLNSLDRETAKRTQPTGEMSQSLVLSRQNSHLEDYVSEAYPRLRMTSSGRQYIETSAYQAGKLEGKKLTLHKAVSSRGGNQGYLVAAPK